MVLNYMNYLYIPLYNKYIIMNNVIILSDTNKCLICNTNILICQSVLFDEPFHVFL